MSSVPIDVDQVGKVIIVRHKGKMYDHHGILDGKGGVIHVHKKKGCISIDSLEKVIGNAKKVTFLEEDFDTRWFQYQKAIALVGSKHQYRFFTDNCESWVNKIRTGKAYSAQLDKISNTAAMSILLLAGIAALGSY